MHDGTSRGRLRTSRSRSTATATDWRAPLVERALADPDAEAPLDELRRRLAPEAMQDLVEELLDRDEDGATVLAARVATGGRSNPGARRALVDALEEVAAGDRTASPAAVVALLALLRTVTPVGSGAVLASLAPPPDPEVATALVAALRTAAEEPDERPAAVEGLAALAAHDDREVRVLSLVALAQLRGLGAGTAAGDAVLGSAEEREDPRVAAALAPDPWGWGPPD